MCRLAVGGRDSPQTSSIVDDGDDEEDDEDDDEDDEDDDDEDDEVDDDDDEDDDNCGWREVPFPPLRQSSLSPAGWSYRCIYIYTYIYI